MIEELIDYMVKVYEPKVVIFYKGYMIRIELIKEMNNDNNKIRQ